MTRLWKVLGRLLGGLERSGHFVGSSEDLLGTFLERFWYHVGRFLDTFGSVFGSRQSTRKLIQDPTQNLDSFCAGLADMLATFLRGGWDIIGQMLGTFFWDVGKSCGATWESFWTVLGLLNKENKQHNNDANIQIHTISYHSCEHSVFWNINRHHGVWLRRC